jgi:hypothetical protein
VIGLSAIIRELINRYRRKVLLEKNPHIVMNHNNSIAPFWIFVKKSYQVVHRQTTYLQDVLILLVCAAVIYPAVNILRLLVVFFRWAFKYVSEGAVGVVRMLQEQWAARSRPRAPPSLLRKPKSERMKEAVKANTHVPSNSVQFDIHSSGHVRTQEFLYNPLTEPRDRVTAQPSQTPTPPEVQQRISAPVIINDPEEIGRRLSERSKIKQRIQTPPPRRRNIPRMQIGKENSHEQNVLPIQPVLPKQPYPTQLRFQNPILTQQHDGAAVPKGTLLPTQPVLHKQPYPTQLPFQNPTRTQHAGTAVPTQPVLPAQPYPTQLPFHSHTPTQHAGAVMLKGTPRPGYRAARSKITLNSTLAAATLSQSAPYQFKLSSLLKEPLPAQVRKRRMEGEEPSMNSTETLAIMPASDQQHAKRRRLATNLVRRPPMAPSFHTRWGQLEEQIFQEFNRKPTNAQAETITTTATGSASVAPPSTFIFGATTPAVAPVDASASATPAPAFYVGDSIPATATGDQSAASACTFGDVKPAASNGAAGTPASTFIFGATTPAASFDATDTTTVTHGNTTQATHDPQTATTAEISKPSTLVLGSTPSDSTTPVRAAGDAKPAVTFGTLDNDTRASSGAESTPSVGATPAFVFGATTGESKPLVFGAASTTPAPAGAKLFVFGAASTASTPAAALTQATSSTPSFLLGPQNVGTPAPTGFSFGDAAAPATAAGSVSFGATPGSLSDPSLGSERPNMVFAFGSTPVSNSQPGTAFDTANQATSSTFGGGDSRSIPAPTPEFRFHAPPTGNSTPGFQVPGAAPVFGTPSAPLGFGTGFQPSATPAPNNSYHSSMNGLGQGAASSRRRATRSKTLRRRV